MGVCFAYGPKIGKGGPDPRSPPPLGTPLLGPGSSPSFGPGPDGPGSWFFGPGNITTSIPHDDENKQTQATDHVNNAPPPPRADYTRLGSFRPVRILTSSANLHVRNGQPV